jgi:hypothetical protein
VTINQARNSPVDPIVRFAPSRDLAFRHELRERARSYLAARGDHRYGNGWQYAKGLMLAVLALSTYWLSIHADTRTQFLPAYTGFTFVSMVLAMNLLNDAADHALFRSATPNDAVMRIVSVPVGIDPNLGDPACAFSPPLRQHRPSRSGHRTQSVSQANTFSTMAAAIPLSTSLLAVDRSAVAAVFVLVFGLGGSARENQNRCARAPHGLARLADVPVGQSAPCTAGARAAHVAVTASRHRLSDGAGRLFDWPDDCLLLSGGDDSWHALG